MRRGDFEELVRRYLDGPLQSRGFRPNPQPPAEVEDERPFALYEADPDDFGERYPALDARAGGNTRCIDLWVHLDPATGHISSELEGRSIDELADRFDVRDPGNLGAPSADIDAQLARLAQRIADALDAVSRSPAR